MSQVLIIMSPLTPKGFNNEDTMIDDTNIAPADEGQDVGAAPAGDQGADALTEAAPADGQGA